MKIQNWYDVECDICGKHLCDFHSDMQRTKKLAIEHAKSHGWKYDKENNRNICAECIELKRK